MREGGVVDEEPGDGVPLQAALNAAVTARKSSPAAATAASPVEGASGHSQRFEFLLSLVIAHPGDPRSPNRWRACDSRCIYPA